MGRAREPRRHRAGRSLRLRRRRAAACSPRRCTTASRSTTRYDAAGFATSRSGVPLVWTATGRLARAGDDAHRMGHGGAADRDHASRVSRASSVSSAGASRAARPRSARSISATSCSISAAPRGAGATSTFAARQSFVSDETGAVVAHYRYHPFGVDAAFGPEAGARPLREPRGLRRVLPARRARARSAGGPFPLAGSDAPARRSVWLCHRESDRLRGCGWKTSREALERRHRGERPQGGGDRTCNRRADLQRRTAAAVAGATCSHWPLPSSSQTSCRPSRKISSGGDAGGGGNPSGGGGGGSGQGCPCRCSSIWASRGSPPTGGGPGCAPFALTRFGDGSEPRSPRSCC